MLDRSGPMDCRVLSRAFFQLGADMVNFVLVCTLFLTFSLLSCSCAAGKKLSKDGYEWIPVKMAISKPTGKQKEMLSLAGEPDAVWKTPFGTAMWVYCRHGSPKSTVIFGEHEVITQGASPDRPDLCKEPR